MEEGDLGGKEGGMNWQTVGGKCVWVIIDVGVAMHADGGDWVPNVPKRPTCKSARASR